MPWPHAHLLNQRKDFRIQNWLLCQGLDTPMQLHQTDRYIRVPEASTGSSQHLFLLFFPNIFQLEGFYNFFPLGGDRPPCRASPARALLSFLPPFTHGPPRRLQTAG